MSIKLLPCPFCGGEAKFRHIKPFGFAYCKNCFASTAPVSDEYMEADCKNKVVALWNRRTQNVDS